MGFLATEIRPPRADGGEALTRLAAEAGAAGLHLAGGCDLGIVAGSPLVASALRLGLEIPSIALPMPERALSGGRRSPRLGALARDERQAAVALAERGLAAASSFGAQIAVIDFGPLTLAADPAAFARAFARQAIAPDDPGGELLAEALAERRSQGPDILDACCWTLERLLQSADRAALRLAIQIGVTPWQAPSPRELGELGAIFGPPLGVAWDPARLSVLAAFGLPIGEERLKSLAAAATLAIENDAVGIETGYLPGLGERDPRLAAHAPPAARPRIVTGGADATDAEVAAVLAAVG